MDDHFALRLDPDRRTLHVSVMDPGHCGKRTEVRVLRRAVVHESGGLDSEVELHRCSLVLMPTTRIDLDEPLDGYSHAGRKVSIEYVAEFRMDGKSPTKGNGEIPFLVPGPERAPQEGDAAKWIEPKDHWSLVANIMALEPSKRIRAIAMSVVCGVLVLVNMAVGWHDQWVPESQTYFYDHHGTKKGRRTSESPLMKAATGSGVIGAGAFVTLMALLRGYMTFNITDRKLPRRGARVAARDLIRGKARIALEGVDVRVVAANREFGEVRKKEGKKTVTNKVVEPVRAVCLYQQRLMHVPANTEIATYLSGDVDFDLVYRTLLPPQRVGRAHGIDVVWEAQLLHPRFVDQEVEGTAEGLTPQQFEP